MSPNAGRWERLHCTPEVGKKMTFDLWPIPWGGGLGVQGRICDILRPLLAMNRFLPLLVTQIPTHWIHTSGGEGGGVGSDIRSMSSNQPICKCRCPPMLHTLPAQYLVTEGRVELETMPLNTSWSKYQEKIAMHWPLPSSMILPILPHPPRCLRLGSGLSSPQKSRRGTWPLLHSFL